MGAQVISVAAGVVSVAIAALGLLLTWYRREASTEAAADAAADPPGSAGKAREEVPESNHGWLQQRTRDRRRTRIFVSFAVGVAVLTAAGVLFTFRLGEPGKSTAPSVSPSAAPAQPTVAQYTGQLGQVCSAAKEKARRIEESKPTDTVLGALLNIEQDEVDQAGRLAPPAGLKSAHDDLLALWQRRISLLESVYRRLPQINDNDNELRSSLAAADKMAGELGKLFTSLGVPECVM